MMDEFSIRCNCKNRRFTERKSKQMAEKASVRCAAESIRDSTTLLYLFSDDFAMDFCKKNARFGSGIRAESGIYADFCIFLRFQEQIEQPTN